MAPGQGAQTPGFLRPWLADPSFADRLSWLSAVAGLDLAHYGTEADAETIRDTAVAQPLLVASGLLAALELFPHPADAFPYIGVAAGHSVGEITAAAGVGVLSAEQAMVFVRERGKAMAAASALTPTSMTAMVGGDAEEVLAALADSRPDRRQQQRHRPDRRRGYGRTAGRAGRRAAQTGPADPAQRGRRLPHRAHGTGRGPPGGPGPGHLHPRPADPAAVQRRRPGGARRTRGPSPAGRTGRLAGALGPLPGHDGRPRE